MGSGWKPTGLSSSDYTLKGLKSHSTGNLGDSMGGDKSKKMTPPPAPPPLPQASKAPDINAIRTSLAGAGQAGSSPGVAQTFLTGAGGVDPSTLTLGRTLLLGN
jgi:hypothetical protein